MYICETFFAFDNAEHVQKRRQGNVFALKCCSLQEGQTGLYHTLLWLIALTVISGRLLCQTMTTGCRKASQRTTLEDYGD